MHPTLTPHLDVALLVLDAFVLFFLGLVFYLRREDRREGYPLEDDLSGRVQTPGGPLHSAAPKSFRLPFGHGIVTTPTGGRDPFRLAARIVPIGHAAMTIAGRDPDPRGMTVVGMDGVVAGTVSDLWVDKADRLIRYLQVALADEAGRQVLVPMPMLKVDRRRRRVVVDAVRASQFANAPAIAAADRITLYEEERVMGYFGGGYLYASAARQEPWL